jgi:hypothetical protein
LMSMDKYILPCTKQQKGPNFTNAELLADWRDDFEGIYWLPVTIQTQTPTDLIKGCPWGNFPDQRLLKSVLFTATTHCEIVHCYQRSQRSDLEGFVSKPELYLQYYSFMGGLSDGLQHFLRVFQKLASGDKRLHLCSIRKEKRYLFCLLSAQLVSCFKLYYRKNKVATDGASLKDL